MTKNAFLKKRQKENKEKIMNFSDRANNFCSAEGVWGDQKIQRALIDNYVNTSLQEHSEDLKRFKLPSGYKSNLSDGLMILCKSLFDRYDNRAHLLLQELIPLLALLIEREQKSALSEAQRATLREEAVVLALKLQQLQKLAESKKLESVAGLADSLQRPLTRLQQFQKASNSNPLCEKLIRDPDFIRGQEHFGDKKSAFTQDFLDLCNYAQSDMGATSTGVPASVSQKQDFYKHFSRYPKLLAKAVYVLNETRERQELRTAREGLKNEINLLRLALEKWNEAVKLGKVPTDLYGSIARKIARFESHLDALANKVVKEEEGLVTLH